nr:hypothetical protein [Polaribacter porphyrae]
MKIFKLSNYNKRALIGGIIAAIFTGFGAFALGSISGYEAKELIKSSLSGFIMLCNTIVLASATILALLLTLISVSSGTKTNLNKSHYKHVILIAKIDTIVFVAAMIIFQFFNLPVTESENVPTEWYAYIYYSTLVISSILSGGLISVVLMLFNAVTSIIKVVGLGIEDHPILLKKEDEQENKKNED